MLNRTKTTQIFKNVDLEVLKLILILGPQNLKYKVFHYIYLFIDSTAYFHVFIKYVVILRKLDTIITQ